MILEMKHGQQLYLDPQPLQKLETDFTVLSFTFRSCVSLVLFPSDLFAFALLIAD